MAGNEKLVAALTRRLGEKEKEYSENKETDNHSCPNKW